MKGHASVKPKAKGRRQAVNTSRRRTLMTSTMRTRIGGALVVAVVAAVSYAAGVAQDKAVNLAVANVKWVPAAPGSPVQVAVLWGDRDKGPEYGMLLKLPAGSEAGIHAHTAATTRSTCRATGSTRTKAIPNRTSCHQAPTQCNRGRRCTTTRARARPTASSSSISTRLEISFRGSSEETMNNKPRARAPIGL